MRIKRFNKTIMGPDMLVELMKILKLAMRKAPCLCFCYVLNFWCFEGNVFKELFKIYIFLVQCHMCHQSAKTFHFCFFMFNITMFHFLFVTSFWIFSYLFKNFSLFLFLFFYVVYLILIVLVKIKIKIFAVVVFIFLFYFSFKNFVCYFFLFFLFFLLLFWLLYFLHVYFIFLSCYCHYFCFLFYFILFCLPIHS
jgi:hypothetical protein